MTYSNFSPEVFRFIREHESDDPYQLSLVIREIMGIPAKIIAEQIVSRQKIRIKAPEWYSCNEIVYPSARAVEQASSTITAQYKSELVNGERIVDLTGGLGIDAWAFSDRFGRIEYNDSDEQLVQTAQYNFEKLRKNNVTFSIKSAEEYIKNIPAHTDVLYLDPSRRDIHNNRKWKLPDSSPDIFKILPSLLKSGCQILIKISPLVDLKYLIKNITGCQKLHIVSVENECKEILMIIRDLSAKNPEVISTDISHDKKRIFEGDFETEKKIKIEYCAPGKYIYEPNVAIQKSGLYRSIGIQYDLAPLHPNSHLYTSNQLEIEFPGRIFIVEGIYPLYEFFRKKPIQKANILIRNFPMQVSEIRRKASLKEDDSRYLIGTTDVSNKPIFIVAERIF